MAVAAAYGLADYKPALPDDKSWRPLIALNLERSMEAKSVQYTAG